MTSPNEPWRRDGAAVAEELGTDLGRGLGVHEAAIRLERYGPNELDAPHVVPAFLEEPAQPELPGNTAQKLTRLEVDPLGRRRGLTVVVALDPGNRLACVRPRIPVNRIVVEDTENLRHSASPSPPAPGMALPILDPP